VTFDALYAFAQVAILIDDMADTCGTLCMAAGKLKEAGAIAIHACVTHGYACNQLFARLIPLAVSGIFRVSTDINQLFCLAIHKTRSMVDQCELRQLIGKAMLMNLYVLSVLSNDAVDKINKSVLETLVVTNTMPVEAKMKLCPKIRQVGIGY
jgi:phosphoribosylpyrophosphate synthetase